MKTQGRISPPKGVTNLYVCGWVRYGSRVPLLRGPSLVLFQDGIDHAQPRSQFGPLHCLLPLVAGRRRVAQHLLNRLSRNSKLARCRPLAPALYQYCSPNPPIELHLEHPPVFHDLRCLRNQLTKPESGGLLLLRRNTPLTQRAVAYFHSGAHTSFEFARYCTSNWHQLSVCCG
jgi:hypothetical protein